MDDIEGFSVVTKKIKKRIYFPKKKKRIYLVNKYHHQLPEYHLVIFVEYEQETMVY
jgi:hypothetical protein